MNTRLVTTLTLLTTFMAADAFAQADGDVPPPPPESSAADARDEPDVLDGLPSDAPTRRELEKFYLDDGQMLIGYGTDMGDSIEIELTNSATIVIPKSSIDYIIGVDEFAKTRTTHRTRYLYSPSGMMLEAGEGYISQKELLFTSAAYGVTDNISVIVGGAIPVWFISFPESFNVIGGVKVGGSVTENLHLSVGAEALFLPGVFGSSGINIGGLAFGNITLGDPTKHLTLNVGVPFFADGSGSGVIGQAYITTLSGYAQLTDGFGLVSENWLTIAPSSQGSGALFNALAGRFHTGDFTIDAGFIITSSFRSSSGIEVFPFPIPWLDFSWSFGG